MFLYEPNNFNPNRIADFLNKKIPPLYFVPQVCREIAL